MISAGDTDAPYTFGARRGKQGQCQGQSMVGVKPGVGQQYTSLVAGYFRISRSQLHPASQPSVFLRLSLFAARPQHVQADHSDCGRQLQLSFSHFNTVVCCAP